MGGEGAEGTSVEENHLRSSVCFTHRCFFPRLMGFVPNLQSPAPYPERHHSNTQLQLLLMGVLG